MSEELADKILALIKEAGYVQVEPAQLEALSPKKMELLAQVIYRAINPSNFINWSNYNGKEAYIEAARQVTITHNTKVQLYQRKE